MKIYIKTMEFSADGSTAKLTFSVNDGADQESQVQVSGLETVIEKTMNKVVLKALQGINDPE